METEERSESYGHSLVKSKKIVEIDGRMVEVRLLETEFGRILPRCRWANRDVLSIKKAYEEGYKKGKEERKVGAKGK